MTDEKPVAWMSPDGKVSQTEGKLFHIPLYTKPQQWYMVNKDGYVKPLSDEEIDDYTKAYFNIHPEAKLSEQFKIKVYELQEFARAIEERHGIK